MFASPLAKKLAAEKGIDLTQVKGMSVSMEWSFTKIEFPPYDQRVQLQLLIYRAVLSGKVGRRMREGTSRVGKLIVLYLVCLRSTCII